MTTPHQHARDNAPLALAALVAVVAAGQCRAHAWQESDGVPVVLASVETEPVPGSGDAADDAAVWVSGDAVAILGTDKRRGLAVFGPDGSMRQFLDVGRLNNVDVRAGLTLAGHAGLTLAAATDRTAGTIALFAPQPLADGGHAWRIVAGAPDSAGVGEPYGLCLHHSATTGELHIFANGKGGVVRQWRVAGGAVRTSEHGAWLTGVRLEAVRQFHVGGQVEGMAADDELGWLYVGEERTGLWRYHTEPWTLPEDHPFTSQESDHERDLVAAVGPAGPLTADVEGVTLVPGKGGGAGEGGLLLVSSQGADRFDAFDRRPPNAFVGSFRVGGEGSIDPVTHTDGIAAYPGPFAEAFPHGVLVVQDDADQIGPGGLDADLGQAGEPGQNFKLVPLERVRAALSAGGRGRTGHERSRETNR